MTRATAITIVIVCLTILLGFGIGFAVVSVLAALGI